MEKRFLPATDANAPEILAGLQAGVLLPWRTGPDGTLWYRRVPIIRGVDPDAEDDLGDDIEADDDDLDCEFYEDDDA